MLSFNPHDFSDTRVSHVTTISLVIRCGKRMMDDIEPKENAFLIMAEPFKPRVRLVDKMHHVHIYLNVNIDKELAEKCNEARRF